jgi:hypothetical protein
MVDGQSSFLLIFELLPVHHPFVKHQGIEFEVLRFPLTPEYLLYK